MSVKTLLTLCGYDSAWSFKSITNEKLVELESYIEKNHRKEADGFEEYKSAHPFEFLPGHNALIFGIKSEIDCFQEKKRQKKDTKPKPAENDLRMNLLFQMSSYTNRLKLSVDWSDTITSSNFQPNGSGACTILCPICSSSFTVKFDSHWKPSNICKHIRSKHATNDIASVAEITRETNKEISNVNTCANNISIPPECTYEEVIIDETTHLDE